MESLKSFLKDIPKPIRLFLGKALLFFIGWKLIYSFFLLDSKLLDYPLTTHVADASVFVLNNIGMSGFAAERDAIEDGGTFVESDSTMLIIHNNEVSLSIADECNALELFILYIGFIICMPSSFWRKVKYIIIGVIIIDIVNILRCCGLIYINENSTEYFEFAHHYVFKIVVYGTTFLMWIVYSRKLSFKNEAL
ncbi:MAG: archaeosortase/exosortase family protein [Jejuia sp.]